MIRCSFGLWKNLMSIFPYVRFYEVNDCIIMKIMGKWINHVNIFVLSVYLQPKQTWLRSVNNKSPLFVKWLTYHGLNDAFCYLNELLVDLDGEVTQHLSVLGQVKVLQAVFILFVCVLWRICLNKNTSSHVRECSQSSRSSWSRSV